LHILRGSRSVQIEECAMPSTFPKEEGEAGWPGAVPRVTERRPALLIICATAVVARLFVGLMWQTTPALRSGMARTLRPVPG
jgi:hypothetical protein